ncbi:hypothetical protein GOD94_17185 [Sinorhizobium medicae]|uniref:hypothetical protein n=1 Tax=Rhizobium meliloti TaxID=382 RepID=UPI00299F4D8A|nr:hypothetical protein [Sinorhizobium meliloti]MDX0443303.1 hypothetical protein [Sinorhizobium medicae]MDW9897720.1 hypothetical protein [Sinorhizobium meliloti]MDX0029739.1 hypothetical protein [Sinorhizobium meliloti]MDX0345429.1 hypothetical protein [Sinorhizobium meliloti]
MTDTKTATRTLPVELRYHDIDVGTALTALAVQLQELAAQRIFPLEDLDCTLAIDVERGLATLKFRAC